MRPHLLQTVPMNAPILEAALDEALGALKAAARLAGTPAADVTLLPSGTRTGLTFRFPAAAAAAMANLDPREAVAIEFLIGGSGAEQVRTAYVEVGDFAAGRAFLTASQR